MADRRSCPRQTHHLVRVEVDSVREPRPLAEPSAILKIVKWATAIDLLAVAVLILGFGEMSMQSHILLCGKRRGRAHQRSRDGKRRAGRKGNLYHRLLAVLVIALDQSLAVVEDRILILDDAVRRKPAIALRQVHGAARQQDSDTARLPPRYLDVNCLIQSLWE